MKKWVFKHIESGRVAHVFFQENEPGEEYLNAFRSIDQASDWELTDHILGYEEELAWVHMMRSTEYPPLTDLADAMFHQEMGDNGPMQAYLAACEAVKIKYPKPTPP